MAGVPQRMNLADEAHRKWALRRLANSGSKEEKSPVESEKETNILSSEKPLVQETKMDLEEYTDQALMGELQRRQRWRSLNLCPYCRKPLSEEKVCRLHEKKTVGQDNSGDLRYFIERCG